MLFDVEEDVDSTVTSLRERTRISKLCDLSACNVERIPLAEAYRFASEFRCQKPVVFTDCKWSLSSKQSVNEILLNSNCQEEQIKLLKSKDNKNFLYHDLCIKEEVTLREALDKLENNDDLLLYLRLYASQFPQIFNSDDALTIESIVSEHHINRSNVGLWISTKGCITPCHFDLCHGLLHQVVGTKTFILCPPEDALNLYYKNKKKGISNINGINNTQTVPVDLNEYFNSSSLHSPIRKEYPMVADCAFFIATLNPSDLLYTPPGSFLYNFLFSIFYFNLIKKTQVGFIMLKVIPIQ